MSDIFESEIISLKQKLDEYRLSIKTLESNICDYKDRERITEALLDHIYRESEKEREG